MDLVSDFDMAVKTIGITGGIGSGKTTVCRELSTKGFHVYESDKEAHRIMNFDKKVISALKQLFGNEIYVENQLDRKKIATLVFENKALLSEMNAIVHPIVKTDFSQWVARHSQEKFLFIESAILFESGFDALCDASVLVVAPENVRISRTMMRDNVSLQQVESRLRNQRPSEELLALSDIVLNNNEATTIATIVNNLLEQLSKRFIP